MLHWRSHIINRCLFSAAPADSFDAHSAAFLTITSITSSITSILSSGGYVKADFWKRSSSWHSA
jgi:hypothetical protein